MINIKKVQGLEWKKTHQPIVKDSKRQMFGYGMELVVNLYDCDLKKISSKSAIQKFVITLCDKVIHMKRYGKTLIPNFGHDNPTTSGYSVVQLIETSSITGHFSDSERSCYLNIFSCAPYDPQKTAQFCKGYFGAQKIDAFLIIRP
ncbi:MAG: hypothetical protein UV55_C0008G0077 [Candidatus Gottesmanbacteria bacterium GW2011_GWC1_43_10]|nr:MAG: hypothetical protein UV17_C0044G0005 [Candidatus Gottesmanbacteria bacterium GW2011_GWA1_42_26]KKS81862.1 MAG: hypothetical protein UV55_C0008G0077 [Candidatus Gottesmanbacteria bacterium GW2011_GWC1_43_10]HCM37502.1 S-adenosylmethionine decarboxylase [Patescibacteria group bacterium]